MIVLTIRTDKPEAEIGLYSDDEQRNYITWHAHRQLAETIHQQLRRLLGDHGQELTSIDGIVAYRGPGSFTGLRIGLAVGNALAYSLDVPIIGATGDDWIASGIQQLMSGNNQKNVVPEYGAPVHITTPRK